MDIKSLANSNSWFFIDYSSLLHPLLGEFVDKIIPILSANHKQIIIPPYCSQKLYLESKDHFALLEKNKDYFIKADTPEDLNTSELSFSYICNKIIDKNNLIIITEDDSLKEYLIKEFSNRGGRLEFVTINYILTYKQYPSKRPHFTISEEITHSIDYNITIDKVPSSGDCLYDENNSPILIKEEIKAGGEGTVYVTNTEFVAKIYHKNKLSSHKKEKILLLSNSGIRVPGVCFPTKALYNSNKEFVGYLMPKAKGHSLDGSIFKGERGMNRYFASWTRSDLVSLTISILYIINRLHKEGIIIGDLNGANILVSSPKEVYFVDTDSYQINEYPCPVGTETFTAPEVQGKDYSTFLRTIENENFSVATVVFKLLMFGMDPYAHLGGESIGMNIKSGEFSFPFQEKSNHKIPDGHWKFYWSHLYFPLKRNFYNTFRKGECLYEPDMRPDTRNWMNLVIAYKQQLEDGSLEKIDPESLKLFPMAYKKDPKQRYVKCKICKKEVAEKFVTEGYCNNCLHDSVIVKCKRCGTYMEFSNYKKYILGKPQPKFCKACTEEYHRRNKVYRRVTCTACGEQFVITVGEYKFYKRNNLDLPKRCKSCRDQRIYANDDDDTDYTPSYTPPTSSSSSGGCYITTAACEYYGKTDDCYELTVLRHFRDEWLVKQPQGLALVSKYYENAPNLVELIKQSEDYNSICLEIMNKGINPCIELINSGKFEECQTLYIEMVSYFYNKLVNN